MRNSAAAPTSGMMSSAGSTQYAYPVEARNSRMGQNRMKAAMTAIAPSASAQAYSPN